MPTGRAEKAKAAPCGTASLLLQRMVDELGLVSETYNPRSRAISMAIFDGIQGGGCRVSRITNWAREKWEP